jgi:hypothetical protein
MQWKNFSFPFTEKKEEFTERIIGSRLGKLVPVLPNFQQLALRLTLKSIRREEEAPKTLTLTRLTD